MGKQLANSDVLLSIRGKFGQIFCHRVVQSKPALLVKLHDRRRRSQHFRQGREVEDGVFRHRFSHRRQRPIAVRLVKDDLAVVTGNHNRSGEFFSGDSGFDNAIDLAELRVLRFHWGASRTMSRIVIFAAGFLGKTLLIIHPKINVSIDPMSTNHVHAIFGTGNQ